MIQARDGRRMSKSLGTGIDPLEEIDVHGADALRFGLLAMSSTQDVRYSDAKVQQGRDLANKLWNASRLILLNAGTTVERRQPAPAPTLEDRWILSRLERTIASVTEKLEAYDFAHAAQEAYSFFWSELCDWYLEIVKPRLYEGEEEVSANLLWALERIARPAAPDHAVRHRGDLVLPPGRAAATSRSTPFPVADESLFDPSAEAEVEARDRADPAPARLARPGRGAGGERCSRRASTGSSRRSSSAASPASSSATTAASRSPRSARSRCSPPTRSTPSAVGAPAREAGARSCAREVARAEGKLANEGFVAKAPGRGGRGGARASSSATGAELEELSE